MRFLALLALTACGDEKTTPTTPATPTGDIEWQACPVITGGGGSDALCASFAVPFDWSNPQGEALELFVKQIPAPASYGGQIWLLAGGPGGGSNTLEPLAEVIHMVRPDLAVFLTDHRGTFRSSLLHCPQLDGITHFELMGLGASEAEPCLTHLTETWGERIHLFTPTAAARDLHALIEATRQESEPVFVYGGSYGTYWALRYLQLFPDQPAGLILDSVVAPPVVNKSEYDLNTNRAGMQLLELCGEDPLCAAKLGGYPVTFTNDLMQRWRNLGHCDALRTAGVDERMLKWMLAASLMTDPTRVDAIAILHRLDRCTSNDIDALVCNAEYWRAFGFGGLGIPLNIHISLSELWPQQSPPTLEEVRAQEAELIFSSGGASALAGIYDVHEQILGRYPLEAGVRDWPVTDTPLLVLHGELDSMSTPGYAQAVAEALDGAYQHTIIFPYAPHGTMFQTPMLDGSTPCGMQLTASFLNDPTAPLPLSCVDELRPVSFASSNASRFGTNDLWEPVAVSCLY